MAYRAFYALPVENFMTSTGQPTNAVYGFTSMLINVLQAEQPTHVVVAFDVSRKTFRSDMFSEYKAQREKSPEEFKGQVELVKELLSALDIQTIALEGFEADDVIATLASEAQADHVNVAIVTGDRDAFQLVSDHVTVLYPKKGVSDLARMTPMAVEDKYGIRPDQYADYAALRGDASDNLPGVPGVGEKTAAKWLVEYGDLASLVDHAPDIPGKVGHAFRDHLPQVLMNRALTQLRSDAPVEVAWGSCQWTGGNDVKVQEVLDSLQFHALRTRLSAVRPQAEQTMSTPDVDLAFTMRELKVSELEPLLSDGVWCVAVDGHTSRGRGHISALAFTQGGQDTFTVKLDGEEFPRFLAAWFGDVTRPKIMHGAKAISLALLTQAQGLGGVEFDTALAAYLIQPGQRSYELSDVAERICGISLNASSSSAQLSMDDETSLHALAGQVAAVHALWQKLTPQIDESEAAPLLHDIEIPTSLALAQMEFLGIALDLPGLRELSAELAHDMQEAETRAHAQVGHAFNLGSPKQLQQVLFEERGLPKTKKIKTGYTTDAEALQSLFATTADPLLEQLLIFRDRMKLRQTVDGLLPLADSHARVHTTFHQTATATGRLSSSDPNLQNIPVRTATGRRIRNCFVAGPDAEGLMTADYSQIEMRIMAHVSQDEGLIAAFISGEDLHTTVGASVFHVDPSDVTLEMRRQIKAMSYGLAYGLSAFGLSQQLDLSVDEARRLMNEYFARFGGVRDYLHRTVEEARRTGFTQTLMGRRRYLPDLTSDNRQRREMAERMALNAPIQGTAADIMKVAMLNVETELRGQGLSSALLLQVHDELVLQIAGGERTEVETLVVSAMRAASTLLVPLDVNIGFGTTWDEAAH